MRLSPLILLVVAVNHAWAGPADDERDLTAALDEVKAKSRTACMRLHDALTPYWGAQDPMEWPRVMRTPLPASAKKTWRAAADACTKQAIAASDMEQWSVSVLLISPVLQDATLRKQAVKRGLELGAIGQRPDGTIERITGTGNDVALPSRTVDATESAPKITGKINSEDVEKVIKRYRGQARFCYESQLANSPSLKGRVVVKFMISPAGKVAQPTVEETTLKNPAVELCLLARMATWTFPNATGDVTVSYPFTFEPAH